MEFRKVFRMNLKEMLLVFLAFTLMVVVSYFSVSVIVEKRLFATARKILISAEMNISSGFHKAEILILNTALDLRRRLDGGQSQEQIKAYIRNLNLPPKEAAGAAGFGRIYGYIRGGYAAGEDWDISDEVNPEGFPWYRDARLAEDRAVLSVPPRDKDTDVFLVTISRSLSAGEEENLGVIAIDVNLDMVSEYFLSITIAEEGHVVLMDGDLDILADPYREIRGLNLGELGPGYPALAAQLTGETDHLYEIKMRDWKGVTVIYSFERMDNGWYIGLSMPIRDYYSDIYRMAAILSLLGLTLAALLCWILIRLGMAKLRADEKNRSKSSFLARMSHEIRTPMNAIFGMSELIMRKAPDGEVREYATVINQSNITLLALINDILDFSKIESGHLRIENRDYHFMSVVNDLISIFRPRFAEKPVDFFVNVDSHIPAELKGDEVRVRQILSNLLNNAVKYTREGRVCLDIHSFRFSSGKIRLIMRVEDTGIGIKQEEIKDLFSEFTRFDNEKNKGIEGAGLGLPIALFLCRKMGGGIEVESRYGEGSVFTATVNQSFSGDKRMAEVINGDKLKVLVFESRPFHRGTLLSALDNLGVHHHCAADLVEFIHELEQGDYGCAIVPSRYSDDCLPSFSRRRGTLRLIFITEMGETFDLRDVGTLMQPVYSLNLANALNGIRESAIQQRSDMVCMTAPGARVLVVDDIPINLRVVKELLVPFEVKVDTCTSGAEALRLVRENYYDLVFMDHMMPDMDGIQTTALIRALGRNDRHFLDLPIVALTANAVRGQKEIFLENGINDFISKPIEMDKLSRVLEKWIPRKKQTGFSRIGGGKESKGVEIFNIPGIDAAEGLRHIGGSLPAYRNILALFCRDAADLIVRIRSSLEEGDTGLYSNLLHAFRGASLNVGAVEAHTIAAELEAADKNGNITLLRERTEEFLGKMEKLVGDIQARLDQREAENTDNENKETLKELRLEDLKESLEKMDITMVDELLAGYREKNLDMKARDFISDITQDILLYEYDRAIAKIEHSGY
jgi:signal transduction histidine kinase/HPt (histidine-containing phosphotransfer) domain-containing protein/ActR/RegA family two-component response regulator